MRILITSRRQIQRSILVLTFGLAGQAAADAWEILDTTEGQDPILILQGFGNIVGGVEAAIEGRSAGDNLPTGTSTVPEPTNTSLPSGILR